MKKQNNTAPNRVSIGVRCEECLHYSKGPRRFERLCAQLGVEPFSPACSEFCPDMLMLSTAKIPLLQGLATLTAGLTRNQLRLLSFTFRNMDYIRKTGFKFGETVVFSIDGQQYLECYVRGIIIGASKDGRTSYIASSLEGMNDSNCMLSLYTSDIMTMEKFAGLRQRLIKRGSIRSPNYRKSILYQLQLSKEEVEIAKAKLLNSPEEYVPPTLDTVPEKWRDPRETGTLKKRKRPEVFEDRKPSTKYADETEFQVKRYKD